MGRLTQAFGFLNVSPKELNPMWIEYNMTQLNVTSKDILELRAEHLKYLREEKKELKKQAELEKLKQPETVQQTFFNDVL